MALLGLDRLTKKDLFTAALWNSLVDILEAKFSSGISESDLSWPLLAQGNIDFQQAYGIIGLRTFWNVINAAEYATLDAAVSAAEASPGAGAGGAVFIPPDTTILANNVSIDASNITIFGAGPTSVIKITAASTNPIFTTPTSGLSDIRFINLTLDGTGGGAGAVGIRARDVTRLQLVDVNLTAFPGDALVLTKGVNDGDSCTDVSLINCHFSGGAGRHVFADDIDGLTMVGCTSRTATGDAVRIAPNSSSSLVRDIVIDGVRVHTGGAKGISIIGSGAAGIDAHSRIKVANCTVTSMAGLPFELGTTSFLLKDAMAENCYAPASATDGLRIASNRGSVVGCNFPSATGDGIDATNSVDLFISSNNCQDAVTGSGVNATSTTDCTVSANNLRDAATAVTTTSSTGLRLRSNHGALGATIGTGYSDNQSSAIGAASNPFAQTLSIPAGTLREGDLIKVTVRAISSGTTDGIILRLGGVQLATTAAIGTAANTVEWIARVAQNPSASGTIVVQHQTTGTTTGTGAPTTVDLTVANTLDILKGGTTDTITINRFYVELIGGV